MKRGKPKGRRVNKELDELRQRYEVTVDQMWEVTRSMPGIRVCERTFRRWVQGEGGGKRAEAALRALEVHYRVASQSVSGEPILDPVTALHELHANVTELLRIRALATELLQHAEKAAARFEQISAALKVP